MKAIKGFNGGLWAFRLVFAVVAAELLIVAGAVVGCFEQDICTDADTQAIKETMQGLAAKSFALYALNLKVGLVSMVGCLVGYILVMRNYR